eukprot:UN06690
MSMHPADARRPPEAADGLRARRRPLLLSLAKIIKIYAKSILKSVIYR